MTDRINPDVAIFKRMVAGDREATEQIICKYSQPIFSYCYRLLHNYHDAENATQEATMKFVKSIGNIREPRKFKSYWFSTAYRCCIDIINARRNDAELDTQVEDPQQKLPDEEIIEKGKVRKLIEIIEEFDPITKDAILLKHYEGFTYNEIAEKLNMPEGTVKSTISRGMDELKRKSKKRGIIQ